MVEGLERTQQESDTGRPDRDRLESTPALGRATRLTFQACFVIYVITLGWLTMRPRAATTRLPLDLVPLDNILEVLLKGESVTYEGAGQVLGNIALFVPLGWLVPMLWPSFRSMWRVVALGTATSVAIELAQLLFIAGRQSSLDDVILNVLGTFVGAVMFLAPRFDLRAARGGDRPPD
jgi:glycopeptide antibiotics resistance protein